MALFLPRKWKDMFPRGILERFCSTRKRAERDAGIALYHCLHFKLNNVLISRAFCHYEIDKQEGKKPTS